MKRLVVIPLAVLLTGVMLSAAACSSDDAAVPQGEPASTVAGSGKGSITVYSGRNEKLIAPLFEQFTRDTGVKVSARYADSASLAAQILEEGGRSPADVFLSQDAGALGALSKKGLLASAPPEAIAAIPAKYRAADDTWVGVSGRARVIVYNPERVPESEVPRSVFELTDAKWKGRIAVAPTNASFQSFVTAMRVQAGEDRTRAWLRGIKANAPVTFPGNLPLVEAVDEGRVDLGLANHYYLYERIESLGQDKVKAKNAFTKNGDPGALVNVAGVGILKSTDAPAAAATFANYLTSKAAQEFFADKTKEYPLVASVPTAPGLVPLTEIESPAIDLSDLDTLEQTLALIRESGLL